MLWANILFAIGLSDPHIMVVCPPFFTWFSLLPIQGKDQSKRSTLCQHFYVQHLLITQTIFAKLGIILSWKNPAWHFQLNPTHTHTLDTAPQSFLFYLRHTIRADSRDVIINYSDIISLLKPYENILYKHDRGEPREETWAVSPYESDFIFLNGLFHLIMSNT